MSNPWFESGRYSVHEELELFQYTLQNGEKAFVCEKDVLTALQKLYMNLAILPTDIVAIVPVLIEAV